MSWNKAELASSCSVFADGDWIESKDQSEFGVRLIQTGNVGYGYFKAKDSKARFISENTFKRLRCTEVKQGDILVSRLPDPVGRACVIPELDVKSITAVDCTIIRTKKEVLNTYFLNYYCQSPQYFEQVQNNITGATRQRISRSLLGKTEIPLPPLATQKKIVAKLDAVFAEIDKASAAAEANAKNAEALFQSYLTDVFERGGEGWTSIKLENLCKNFKQDIVDGPFGAELKREDYIESGVPVLKIQNIKSFNIILKKMDFISVEKYKSLFRHSYTNGDIIMTKLGNPLGVSAIVNDVDDGVIVADLVRIRAKKIDTEYLCYFLNSSKTSAYINDQQKGTTRPRVRLSVVREIPIRVPPINSQREVVNKIKAFSHQVEKIITSRKKLILSLNLLKQSILKQAFNGELVKE